MSSDAARPAPGGVKQIDAFLIILAVAVLAFAATYLVPYGQFTVGPDGAVTQQSYTQVDGHPGAPLLGDETRTGLLTFLFDGLVSGDRNSASVGLMAFILIIGGSFGVVMRTGAVERAIRNSLARRKKPNDFFVASLFIVFSLAGAVFGMSEEAIVFTLIIAPALMRAGYDSITGVFCCYGATQFGFAASWMNPFNVVIAQGIADVPILSGAGFRIIMWTVFTLAGAAFIWRYARKIRLNPEASLSYRSDLKWRDDTVATSNDDISSARLGVDDWLVLGLVAGGVAWVIWGVVAQGYYLAEIAAVFFTMGLGAGVIGRAFRMNGAGSGDLVAAFRDGAVQLAPAAIIVAAAKGVVLLLGGDDPAAPSVLNTLLFHAGAATDALPDWAAAWGMLVAQSGLNLFVVSGSGQAALTMPLMAPLADLSGVSRQTAVLAFQLGDGLTNIAVPASAALMGCLAAARLDWIVWIRFIWRPLLAALLGASAFVLVAHAIGYS